jgi:D-amino-acid dehydrogenase
MKIAILGAGVVGLASAWWLSRDGHDVVVIDRAAEVGQGTSFANGAQLSYSYVAPMASRAVLGSLPKYLLSPSSPIRFVPRADRAQWLWVANFLRACNADTAALNTARLLALSFASRDALQEMLARTPMAFDHARNGKLVLPASLAGLRDAEAQVRLQAMMGCEQHMLTAAECLAAEPGLASIGSRLVGGVLTPSEEVGDCRKLCEELCRVLRPGVTFALGRAVERLRVEGGRVAGIETAAGVIEADLYVLAAGIASRELGEQAGVTLRMQPIRGYSITAEVRHAELAPRHSITDLHRKTVFAPVGGRMRLAGFAEIGGNGQAIPPPRIATLVRTLESTFPGACALDDVHPWSGFRPATPTDVPVIGRARLDNLLLNLGHGSLGFTLSAGSGRLLADIVAGRPAAIPEADYALR